MAKIVLTESEFNQYIDNLVTEEVNEFAPLIAAGVRLGAKWLGKKLLKKGVGKMAMNGAKGMLKNGGRKGIGQMFGNVLKNLGGQQRGQAGNLIQKLIKSGMKPQQIQGALRQGGGMNNIIPILTQLLQSRNQGGGMQMSY